MSFSYLTNEPLEKAQTKYMQTLKSQGLKARTEVIPVQNANGRITAATVHANISAPHYPASAMDGIAVVAKDTFGASETTPVKLNESQFIVVDTGDPVPADCDAVIMVEDISRQDDGSVIIYAPASPWQHVRQIGEDICAGEMILASRTEITPASIGAMLAGGVMNVEVFAKPVIGIIPTGDEIIPPTADPKPGDIIEFNSSIFSGMLSDWAAEPKTYPIVPDKRELIEHALTKAISECDIVLINAGSSAGREDFTTEVIDKVGTVLFHGIAIKPGKPAILAYCGAKPVIGVPGYPVSGILVLELFLKPVIDEWYCSEVKPDEYLEAVLARPVVSGLKYEEFVRVRLGEVAGKMMATPLNRGAGVVSSFMKADGIVAVPQGCEGYEAGSTVRVRLLKPADRFNKILFAIGSHDPLIDELADMIHIADPQYYLSSNHVGSMGGIMAIRRGETHIAGCHLLDENDGTYNTSYIEHYFPNGGIYQVECVGRTQGLMVQKGNPKNITSIRDIAKDGVRYVNRQKGAGTRVLLDYLIKKENLDISDIYGYDREEPTHTSVAAQIANDTADAGMGIYSAAMAYDLDFIPICMEQYDLLIPEKVWDTTQVKLLIEILKSDEFRSRIEKLGGYEIKHPGEVIHKF